MVTPMARRKVEVRREEILAAAEAEVAKRGFAHTRVADVASALGVSTALVFYHFGTKEKLFAAALEYAVNRDLARLDLTVSKATGPVDGVRRVLAMYSPAGDAYGWTVWVDAWAESLREPEMRSMYLRLDSRWKDVLSEQIRAGVTAGVFQCADPDASAWRLSALLDGLAVQVMMHGKLTRKKLREWVLSAAAHELGVTPESLA